MGVIGGLIGSVLGNPAATASIGKAAADVAEVFTPNATKRMQADADARLATLGQYGQEFQIPRQGWFDAFVNGLNRLPRPAMAFGTLGLFVYAMADPGGFSLRMQGLNYVPEPLWWLLGAVVSFYFGAREAHYLRARVPAPPPGALGAVNGEILSPGEGVQVDGATRQPAEPGAREANAALDDWRKSRAAAAVR
jgi:hypothetical protein